MRLPLQRALAHHLLRALIAAGCFTEVLVEEGVSGAVKPTESSELVVSLRRQLMADNYDYMSSESDAGFPTHPPDTADAPAPVARAHFEPDEPTAAPPLDKNDLLYYVDESRLSRRRADYAPPVLGDEPVPPPDMPGGDPDPPPDTTPQAKYKILKVKTGSKTRRSGGPAYRRFLQEERPDGVAIINLGDEPFPEFRLPSARRAASDEVPPPPALHDLEEAVPTDTDTEDFAGPHPPID